MSDSSDPSSENDFYSVVHGDEVLYAIEQAETDENVLEEIDLTPEQRAGFTTLLEPFARAGVGLLQMAANGGLVRLVPSEGLAASIGTEALRHSWDGASFASNVMNSNGQIVGNWRFRPNQLAKGINVAGAVWQIAAAVTAQHYIHEINKNLVNIEVKVDNLLQFMNNKQTAKLMAASDKITRHIKYANSDGAGETERLGLVQAIEQVFDEVRENLELRLIGTKKEIGRIWSEQPSKPWATAGPEIAAFVGAYRIGAQVLFASRMAEQPEHYFEGYMESLDDLFNKFLNIVEEFRESFEAFVQDIEDNTEKHTDESIWTILNPFSGPSREDRLVDFLNGLDEMEEQLNCLGDQVYGTNELISELYYRTPDFFNPDEIKPMILCVNSSGEVIRVFAEAGPVPIQETA